MNTMRLVFAIAVALALHGTANAANLRRVATEIKATVADATLVDTLADKYDCRQAGATLAETLENIATKNGQARASLDIECQERTVNITAPWTRAKKTYATDFPTVKTEENERFSTAKKAADETFQTLEKERNDAVLKQEIVYSAKKELSDLAVSAYSTATSAWQKATDLKVASEKEFNDVTLPDGNKINAEAFKVSNNTAAAAMNGLIATAFALRTSADALCTESKRDREKLIIADEELLKNDIGPLIKELSELKCVDNYDDAKMTGGTTLFVEVDANVVAQCAMTSKKITALLVKSDSTTTPDAPIMAQLGTFSTRVSEERKHMETLVITCLTKASTNFLNTKMEATDQNNVEVGKAQALQTAADQELVNALATLIQKNNESVKKLLQTLEELLAKKKASVEQTNTALTDFDNAKDARAIDIPQAETLRNATVLAAENVKDGNIETRQTVLEEEKTKAENEFNDEEKFLVKHCESTKKELEKELDVVNQIQGKLGGLKVTDTAATGLKAEQKDTQAAPAAEPAASALMSSLNEAVKEAEAERLAEELEEKRIAEQQAAAEVAAAAAKAKVNRNKPVPNGGCQKKWYDADIDENRLLPKHGLEKLIEDYLRSDEKKELIVAEYGKIENWNTKFVTHLECAFYYLHSFNADISKWDVSSVTTLRRTFNGASSFNADISQWDVSSVTNLDSTFAAAKAFNGSISQWDVSSVTSLDSTFYLAKAFNADISKWVVSRVTTMRWTFYQAKAFNANINKWDVSNVTTMERTFASASSFNADISNWDVSRVTNLRSTFEGASSFNADISQWVVSSLTDLYHTFYRAAAFNADISNWDVSRVPSHLADSSYKGQSL